MRLGELLVRDGRLTEAQLDAALKHHARDGGRIGTVLVEHGLIDLEALTLYLGLEFAVPIATGAMLERAKLAAVRLLQPQQAFKYKIVPLVVQDRQLIAAVEDPHDFASLDAVSSIIGYRVLPRVAPELRIYYYVERYYGVARAARFVKFGDLPRGSDEAPSAGLPAPPLPGLPPPPAAPIAAPGPRPHLRSIKVATEFDDSEALELEAEDLLDSLEADGTAAAEAAPVTHAEVRGPVTEEPIVASIAVAPMPSDRVMHALATATDRNHIGEALLDYAAATFDAAVVFTVRDHMAFGWKAIGNLPGSASVEHLLIPLQAPSVLRAALAADNHVVHGPLAPSTVNSHLYTVLGCAVPAIVTAGVIAIGKRVVNILYGHGAAMTPAQVGVLQQVCMTAAQAYARLIASKKR